MYYDSRVLQEVKKVNMDMYTQRDFIVIFPFWLGIIWNTKKLQKVHGKYNEKISLFLEPFFFPQIHLYE